MAIGDNNSIGRNFPDRVRENVAHRPTDQTDARGLPEFAPTRRQKSRDPYDLKGAFNRLRDLLGLDGLRGPRRDVPDRGFYLNILV